MDQIVTEHIRMNYKAAVVLEDINLTIEKGKIFGLLGPSGAGKTTLIHILTAQLKPVSGRAVIMGTDTVHMTGEIYRKIGMVLDNSGLYERLTCYDNLVLFAEIYGIKYGEIRRNLARTGLEEAAKRPVYKLSKGMRQRLVLARAIMHEPEILFLDEPTGGLDPGTARFIHKLIMEEKQKGTTIFLTTHRMEEAEKLCDTVALLNMGKIVERGRPDEICRKYNRQNKFRIRLKSGENLFLDNNETSAESIKKYLLENSIESIHSTEPNLETVFIELTGRNLNNEY